MAFSIVTVLFDQMSSFLINPISITCLLATVLILLKIGVSWLLNGTKDLPPGPKGWPILGFLPYMGGKPHETLFHLRKKYGPVVSIQLGTKKVVVLNSLKVIKEAFLKPAFSGRPSPMPFQIGSENIGFVDQSGEEWKEQRQFSIKVLKKLGFGTIRMEDHIMDEIYCLLDYLKAHDGQVTDMVEIMTPSVSNIINALSLGRRLDLKDPKRKLLDEILDAGIPLFKQVAGVYFMPWLIRILIKNLSSLYSKGRKYLEIQFDILNEEISDHIKDLNVNHPRDYIDSYLIEMNKVAQKDQHYFHRRNLVGNLRLLSNAGTDTILTSVEWAFLAMAAYPDIQARVFSEIDTVIGSDRSPSFSDQVLMPFTQAVILEIHRWRTNLPLNILRKTMKTTSVGGFTLPPETIVLANFWAVHNDPEHWQRPQDFIPERFLLNRNEIDANKSELIATFSFGPRTCPGKALANLEMFLYFVTILQKFQISPPEGQVLTLDGKLEISYKPVEVKLLFRSRAL